MTCQLDIHDLGRAPYEPTLQLQRRHQQEVIEGRDQQAPRPFRLLLVEHDPPVVTISRRPGAREHLVACDAQLQEAGVEVRETDRGGDITFHGPGQLVGYPILDLNELDLKMHGYLRFLEQVVIEVLRRFGIDAGRDECATGVWVADAKICAMGIRVSRWVSMHGFALNVDPDMACFDLIVPCGLAGRSVTSMRALLGDECPSMEAVKAVAAEVFEQELLSRRRPRVQTTPRR